MIRNQSEFSKDSFQSRSGSVGFTKRTFLKVAAFASLGMSPFLNTCGIMSSADTRQGPAKKLGGPTRNGAAPKAARPPIDLAAPTRIDTATFALG